MLKIKDNVDLKELEKYHYTNHQMDDAEIAYYKLVPENGIMITILKNRKIDYELPMFSKIKKNEIRISNYIYDLIQAGLVEKVKEKYM